VASDYVQFGCGVSTPEGWRHFDAGPAFWLQKNMPFLTPTLVKKGFPQYPVKSITYADVIKGLPVDPQSVSGVYCSHVLEHLPLDGFRVTLRNVFTYLRPGGRFRLVLPDIEFLTRQYLANPSSDAASSFMQDTHLGVKQVSSGLGSVVRSIFGRSGHMWMWDYKAMERELSEAGFVEIRRAYFNDSEDPRFKEIEAIGRWQDQLGVECKRP
jgi:predicted SAM-dependent methyltransferase